MDDTRASITVALLVTFAVAVSVCALSLYFILETGVCCADDAYHAIIAKFLATKGYYGLPLSSTRFDFFSPDIGSGPGLIVPAAVAIKLFGAKAWVPGLAALILFTCMMVAACLVMMRHFSVTGSVLFIAVLVAALNVFSGWQWYVPVLLGELPTFGLILIGAALLVLHRNVYFAGLAFGAAFLTKQIALFSEIGIVIAWAGFQLRRSGWRYTVLELARLLAAAALPVLGYELCKLIALGPSGYVDNWSKVLSVTKSRAVGGPLTLAVRLQSFWDVLSKEYFVGWNTGAAGLTGIVALGLLSRAKDNRSSSTFMFGCLLVAGGVVHLAYMLLVSTMWTRYFYIGMALLVAAAASPILSIRNPIKFAYAAIVASLFLTPTALERLVNRATEGTRTHHAENLMQVARYVDEHATLPIVTLNWASFFDVLLVLKKEHEWVFLWGLNAIKDRSYMAVINDHFVKAVPEEFRQAVAGCQLDLELEVYRIYLCNSRQ